MENKREKNTSEYLLKIKAAIHNKHLVMNMLVPVAKVIEHKLATAVFSKVCAYTFNKLIALSLFQMNTNDHKFVLNVVRGALEILLHENWQMFFFESDIRSL